NPHIADVLALIDPNGHGQIIPTPGSEPAVKGFDAVVDQAEFDFPDNVALPGEFDMSWTVPGAATPGALICNYAKDTGGSDVGGNVLFAGALIVSGGLLLLASGRRRRLNG